MSATGTGTDTYRAFAARVRTQLATREGSPTMETTTTEDTEAPANPIPATFLAEPDAACEVHVWCAESGEHMDHFGRTVSLPTSEGLPPILTAHFYTDQDSGAPELDFDPGHDDWREYTSGDQLREQTAKIRAHLARLDALADEYDAIREGSGEPADAAPAEPDRGHYPWCVPGGCLTTTDEDGVPYTMHEGPSNELPVRGRHGEDRTDPLLQSRLYDEDANFSPVVAVTFWNEGTVYTAAEADELIADFEVFLTGLKAQRAQLDRAPVEPGQESRTWTIATEHGAKISGHLPVWSEDDPSVSGVETNSLGMHVSDVIFTRAYAGQLMTVDAPLGVNHAQEVAEDEVFRARFRCMPYSGDPEDRIPHATVTLLDNCDIDHLGPDDLSKLAGQLRSQSVVFDQAARDLVAAREDWAKNGGNH